jgi:hypothetical protein
MADAPEQVALSFGQYWAALMGLLIVTVYAWERFNEPSFPNRETLPSTVVPLRYLFLRPQYPRARLTYVVASLTLYAMLVWPGPSIIDVFGVDSSTFPPQAWALLVALIMVGLVPNSNLKWLVKIEEQLRRWVHEWFLVPNGIEETIQVLEDTRFELSAAQWEIVPDGARNTLRADLSLRTNMLRHRWARATVIMQGLMQMGTDPSYPIVRSSIAPFQDDLDALRIKYKLLEKEFKALGETSDPQADESLTASVDHFMKRLYALLSWVIRYQASSDQEVNAILEELGFRIPQRKTRRLSDIVLPAVCLVALISMVFWLAVDAALGKLGATSTIFALTSATAACLMYGHGIFFALAERSARIERKVWRQAAASQYRWIAFKAGIVAWIVIVISTVVWSVPQTLESVVALVQAVKAVALGAEIPNAAWQFLPIRLITAFPWTLAGAALSVLVAVRVGGEVRWTGRRQRAADALIVGTGLAVAVVFAQLIQTSLSQFFKEEASFDLIPFVGLAGFACGAVIGAMVPHACQALIVTPSDRTVASELKSLIRRAEATLGSRERAERWAFTPHPELGDVTPAEAVQYRTYATGVIRLLESEALEDGAEAQSAARSRPTPVVIDGGRALG